MKIMRGGAELDIEGSAQKPVKDEGKITTMEAPTKEERLLAENTIRETLGVSTETSLENFSDLLAAKVKEISRYKKASDLLKDIEGPDVAYELFKQIQATSDSKEEATSGDGVFVQSIKQGRLACAGRSLLSSIFLQERGIPHSVVFAGKHSFLLAETEPDTLAYFDPEANIYFTFPKKAINYQGPKTTKRYSIKNLTTREADVFDGIGMVRREFLAMEPKEGVARQYLMNVAAALAGNEEYRGAYPKNKGAADAVSTIEVELLGQRPSALDEFYKESEGLANLDNAYWASAQETAQRIYRSYPDFNDFKRFFLAALDGELKDVLPYLKNANPGKKESAIKSIYESLERFDKPEN